MDREIRTYLKLLKKWWWLLIVSALIPAGISYQFASQQQKLYQAKSTLMVGSTLQNPDPDPWQLNLSNTLAAAYAELVRQGPVTEAVVERLGLQRSPETLASQIGTRIYSGAHLLEIQVTDSNPDAAALIANALADELIRRSPTSAENDPEQQLFIRAQLEDLQSKIHSTGLQIEELSASLSELTSATEIQEVQDQMAALEEVRSLYQSTYSNLLAVYQSESPNALSLFEPAVRPRSPIPSKTKLIVAAAGAAGLGLALAAVFMMEFLDTTLRWEGEGAHTIQGLKVLGAIPQMSRKDALSAGNPLSPMTEGIRTLRANTFLIRPNKPFRTLLMTSANPDEGKSSVLGNLAIVLASSGNRVVAIDADMRRPSLHELLDRPNVRGLSDLLSNSKNGSAEDFDSFLLETDHENLKLLSAGRSAVDPATLLTSPRLPILLAHLQEQSDIVLVDSPPVLGPSDAVILATLAEGTILVAAVGSTRRETLQQAKERLLAQKGVNLLGLAVNRVRAKGSYYYYRSPQADGGGEGSSKDEWLSLAQAAARLGISKKMTRRWAKEEKLQSQRDRLRLMVRREDVERLAESWRSEQGA